MKKNQIPTEGSFSQFLHWLDEGVDSGGERYLEMRRRLVCYFDRKSCRSPDDLADETLNRVARRLEEQGAITDAVPARYCYIVAKFVFLEYLRQVPRTQASLDELPACDEPASEPMAPASLGLAQQTRERLLDCLEHCLEKLAPNDRDLIVNYYRGERRVKIESRRELAVRLGLTINALSIRACRIRDKLEACVKTCGAEE